MKKLKILLLLTLFSLVGYGQCPPNHVAIVIDIETDNYPEETYWMVFAHQYPGINAGDTLAQVAAGYYTVSNTHHYDTICLPPMLNYAVLIRDTYGDGLLTGGINVLECGTDTSWSYGPANFTGQYTTQPWPLCGPGLTLGCTDSTAQNYNPNAVLDDGSCTYPSGCTNPNATNYDPLAIVDDGSCTYPPCGGFISSNAYQMCWGGQTGISFEWESDANTGCDVTIFHFGDESGFTEEYYGYWPANNGWTNLAVAAGNGPQPPNWSLEHYAVLEYLDGSLSDTIFFTPTPCILGCMDSTQLAYNPWANVDDGSCAGTNCDAATEYQISMSITLDNWPSETSWDMATNTYAGSINMPAGTYTFNDIGQTYTYDFCVSSTAGFEMVVHDQFGDGMAGNGVPGNEGEVVIFDCNGDTITYLSSGTWVDGTSTPQGVDFGGYPNGTVAYSTPQQGVACAGVVNIPGCTDPMYQEFNSLANVDDSSCTNLNIFGCTDPTSFNYDTTATQMSIEPICNYTLIIEDDAADGWGNSYLGVSQGDSNWTFNMSSGNYADTFSLPLVTNKLVTVYYFEVQGAQQSLQAMEFQTMQNSFTLQNADDVILLEEGTNPFANNGQGALQNFGTPFWTTYSALPYCGDYCITAVYGCMDSTALNYDSLANTPTSCTPIVLGCTNSLAFNYDPLANVDDSTCVPIIIGCMDMAAFNYNPIANTNDQSSCIPVILGCMDDSMFNYNPAANTDDSSCIAIIFGCIDSLAINYDSNANTNNGSCIPVILGCTDPLAFNFDPNANTNDLSCIPVIIGCTDPTALNYDSTSNTNNGCIYPILGCTDPTMFNYDINANTDDGTCIPYIYGCTDSTAINYCDTCNTNVGCVYPILGCTDPSMFNYDPLANTNDGSCVPFIYGCMDNAMYNYDPLANTDNNSCIPFIYGCTDSTAFNYDPLANTDNLTCVGIIYGCTNPIALNYDANSNTDDGSCVLPIYGCTDSTMYNYNPLANTDNGTCEGYVYGCTNPIALNFNTAANTDDGTCILPIYGCTDSTMYNYNPLANTDNGTCEPFIYGCTNPIALNYNATANTDDGTCITPIYGCMDSIMYNYNPLANVDNGSCEPFIYGCNDAAALNFNPLANTSDNSCCYIAGCTDSTALNYNPSACYDDNTCITIVIGCTDASAYNYNPSANVADSTACLYDAGCYGGPGIPYWLNDGCYVWVIDIDDYCCTNDWDASCQSMYDYCSNGWPTSVDELGGTGIIVYPNPTRDILNIETRLDITVEVYDMMGRLIINDKTKRVNLSGYPSGTYNMILIYNELRISKRVIKQ